jgi:hypothetical protein
VAHETGRQKLRKILLARLAVLDIKIRASKDDLRREELRLEVTRAESDLDAASPGALARRARPASGTRSHG